MKNPSISIVIPVFNCEKYVGQAIDSAFLQEVDDIEVVAVDDASTDGSYKLLKKLQKKDSRIRVFQHKINRRQGAARNTGLKKARGEFVFFLDADDWLTKGSLKKVLTIARKKSADVVAVGVQTVSKGNKKKVFHSWSFESKGGLQGVQYFSEYKIGALANKLYRVSFLKKHNLQYLESFYHEDIPFTAYVAFFCKKYVSLPEIYYNYRMNDSSTIRKTPTRLHLDSYFNLFGVMEEYCGLLEKEGIRNIELIIRLIQNYGSAELFPKFKNYAAGKKKSAFMREVFESANSILGPKGLALADMVSQTFSQYAKKG